MELLQLKLDELLKAKGMKQMELAGISNVSHSSISNLCSNRSISVSLVNLGKIAKALEISDMNELFCLVEE